MALPLTWLPQAHISHCPAEEAEEEVQAKPSAQASAAVSESSCVCLKDIEASGGCDLLRGLSS